MMEGKKKNVLYAAMSRRRALVSGVAGFAGLAAAALVGCSSNAKPAAPDKPPAGGAAAPAAPNNQPKRGGTLKIPIKTDPDTLDPVSSVGAAGATAAATHYYSRLFIEKGGDGGPAPGEILGDLVEKWEYPDPLTSIWHLNKAAKWDAREPTNGRAVNADDVVQSWNRWAAQDTFRSLLSNKASRDASIKSVEAIDASTLRVSWAFPDTTALPILAASRFFVQPAEGLAGKIDLKKSPRGSGPFIFDNYTSQVMLKVKRNPDWFLGGGERPYLDGIDMPVIPEVAQQEVQFRAKNLHLDSVSQANIPSFAKDLSGTLLVVGSPKASSPNLGFSYAPGQPWHDVRVRRAASMALDRDKIAEVFEEPKKFEALGVKLTARWNAPLGGGYGAYWLDPKSTQFGPAGAYLKHNLAEAVKLLAAAGFTAAKPLEFDQVFPGIHWGLDWPDRVQVHQSMFRDAGIKMNVASVDYVQVYNQGYLRTHAQFKGRTTEAAMQFNPGGASPDPLAFYLQRLNSNGASDEVGTKYPELDEMERKQRGVTNFAERVEGMHNLHRWAIDNMITIPCAPYTETVGLVWKELRGPERYRSWLESNVGLGSDAYSSARYWFDKPI